MGHNLSNFIPLLCCGIRRYALLTNPLYDHSALPSVNCIAVLQDFQVQGASVIDINTSFSTLISFGQSSHRRSGLSASADQAVRCETLILLTKSIFSSSSEYLVWGCHTLTSVGTFQKNSCWKLAAPAESEWKSVIVGMTKPFSGTRMARVFGDKFGCGN